MIKQYLRMGRAVIILDGMDEITIANQREDVVRAIEVFINDWINAQGKNISTAEKSSLWHRLAKKEPAKTGGNQIIITSRIVGYHVRPIAGHVAHVTIQPMQQVAVEHFCDAWTFATTHQLLYPKESVETIQSLADTEAEGLKKAIFDPLRPRVRELASNPLLITILALVYRKNERRLPEQRTELYSKALEILIEGWRITGMKTKELIYVLSPLAAHIHQHSSNGSIKEPDMKEIITEALAQYRRQGDRLDLPPAFEAEVDAFIQRVREDVGLLSERSERLYGFLHLTFQEYLAALYLIRDERNAPQAIIARLDDPRWREPILMALGHISIYWGSNARHLLLKTLLNADDLGDLIPRSALLIISAIPEMAQISVDIIQEIIRRLLRTYADRDGAGQFSTLHERISNSLKNLYNSPHQQLVEQYLETTILDIETGNRNLALASASLIAENRWDNDALLKALIKAYPYDDPSWEYPITLTLILRSNSLPVVSDTLPLRKYLEAEPKLVEYIQNNLTWLCLMGLLYGGISDNDLATYAVQRNELSRVFYLKGASRQQYIDQLKTRDYWRESWNQDDISEVVHQLAIYLDTECVHYAEKAIKHIPQFTVQAILNDSPLTPMLLTALRQKKHPSALKSRLWREWNFARQNVLRVHALLALLIIDPQQAVDTLTRSFQNTATFPLATLAFNQLKQRKHTLTNVLILSRQKRTDRSISATIATTG